MFKKLLSNLPFNPSLLDQVSFYTERLKGERFVRGMGFFTLILALLLQSFAVISPPQSSLAASGNDIIPGGITSQADAVKWCTTNLEIETIFKHFGVSCEAVSGGSVVNVNSRDHNNQLYSLGRYPYQKPGEVSVPIGSQTFYMRPLSAWDSGTSSTYQAIKGTRANGTTFYILFNCGNIVIIGAPEQPAEGALDEVNCTNIFGWAFDRSLPSKSIEVHIYIDNGLWTGVTANDSRPDVGSAFPGAGNNHGYSIGTPSSIKDGQSHKVEAYAIGIDNSGNKDNANPLIGVKTVRLHCSNPTPTPTTTTPPSPTDACPNLAGIQTNSNQCDVCPNTPGVQSSTSQCDLCPNISGIQTSVSQCDVCPNLSGVQVSTSQCDLCPAIPGVQSNTNECKPCDKSTGETDTSSCIVLSKKARNITRDIADADGTTARGGDVISYTLSARNTGLATAEDFEIEESIGDVLDYAEITDIHGGSWDKNTNIITWPKKDILAGATNTALLTVKIKNPVPQTPISTSNPGTGDLTMTNVYGNAINIKLPPTIVKTTEQITTKTLPNTGPGTSMVMIVSMVMLVGYFYARNRLMVDELLIVKREFSVGGPA